MLYYERVIFAEEAFLRKKFGEEFIAWASVTPVLFPKFSHYKKAELPFCWKNVIRKEYQTIFAFICALLAMEIFSDLIIRQRFELDLAWKIIFLTSCLFYLTIRIITKKTNLLHTSGR